MATGRLLPATATGRLLPVTGRPVRTIAAMRVVDEGTTGPAGSEHSTDANPAGLYRTASASPIAAIRRFAIRPALDDRCHRHGGRNHYAVFPVTRATTAKGTRQPRRR